MVALVKFDLLMIAILPLTQSLSEWPWIYLGMAGE
jgi:hypothetical protein